MPAFEGGALSEGADGPSVTASDFLGKEGVDGRFTAQGLEALSEKEFDDVALVHAPHPGVEVDAIHQVIVSHCESNRFRLRSWIVIRGLRRSLHLIPEHDSTRRSLRSTARG